MGGVPPKPGLGRGLGTLLRDAPRTRPDSAETGKAVPEKPALSPGMATLLRGANGQSKELVAAPPDKRPHKLGVLRPTLVAADVLLCALVAWLAFFGPRPWGGLEVLLCVVALATGAWLTYLALTLD